MWVDVLTVLGFAITVLTWFRITPQRIRKLTMKHVVRNRLTLQSMVITAFGMALIVLYVQAGIHNWWPYAEASWVGLYSWLVYATGRFEDGRALSRAMKAVRAVAPMMFVGTTFARLDYALNTGVFAGTSSLNKWATLGTSGGFLLLVGFSVGSSIVLWGLEKRVAALERLSGETSRQSDHVKKLAEKLRAKES